MASASAGPTGGSISAVTDIQFDVTACERRAWELGGALDQVPFALAGALTDAAFIARRHLVEQTWPGKIAVVDNLGRAHLKLQAAGGVKKARGRLAITTSRDLRGAGGVAKSSVRLPSSARSSRAASSFRWSGKGRAPPARGMDRDQCSRADRPACGGRGTGAVGLYHCRHLEPRFQPGPGVRRGAAFYVDSGSRSIASRCSATAVPPRAPLTRARRRPIGTPSSKVLRMAPRSG
jgi:hypothetical protein